MTIRGKGESRGGFDTATSPESIFHSTTGTRIRKLTSSLKFCQLHVVAVLDEALGTDPELPGRDRALNAAGGSAELTGIAEAVPVRAPDSFHVEHDYLFLS